MNTLFWVRHGENPANLTTEFSCRRVDYSLTAKGRLQAQQTAAYFRTQPRIDALYCSPMRRTVETAEIIGQALRLAPIAVEDLREINVGDLEEAIPDAANWARHDAVMAAWVAGQTELAFPGGESALALHARMNAGLMQVAGEGDGRRLLVIGHGGALWVHLPFLCPGVSYSTLGENHNCSVTELAVRRGATGLTGRLLRYGDVSHLTGFAADLVSALPDAGAFP